MIRSLAVVLCSVVLSSSAFAQTIVYQPVQYQFSAGRGDEKYLYGGTNVMVHAMARRCAPYGFATNLHRFDGGNSFGQPSPMYDRTAIYSDCVGMQNAAHFGFNEADARNEAYANAPRYFRKADLLASAVPAGDGTLLVPATAPHYVASAVDRSYSTLPGMPARGQVIIIPKKLLDRPVKDFESRPAKVASAQ